MDYSIHRKKPKTYDLSATDFLLLLLLFYVILYTIDYFNPKGLEIKEKDITNDTRAEALQKSIGHVGISNVAENTIFEVTGNVDVTGSQVSLASGAEVALARGSQVSLASGAEVALASGSQVSLASGAEVALASGSQVSLASGAEVALASGSQVSLASGAEVALASGSQVALASGASVTLSSGASVGIADGPNLDAFSRLRISDPHVIFDSKMLVDNLPLIYDDAQVSGSGTSSTYNTNQSSVTLAVSATTAGHRVRQSKAYHDYQPGKSQLCLLTGILGTMSSGNTSRIGIFDSNNGYFFQSTGGVISLGYRAYLTGSPVDTVVPQASWNLDTLDGNGTSGLTLDPTKTNIFIIDFQWLGVGRIRYGLDMNGAIIYVHTIYNDNMRTTVYLTNPCLPIRYEIINDGTGGADSMSQICSAIISEGGSEFTGITRGIDRGTSSVTVGDNTNKHIILAIRLKSTHRHATVNIKEVSILCTSSADFLWALILNPTLAGSVGSLSFTSETNSSVEVDKTVNSTAGQNFATGGTVLKCGYENQAASTTSSSFLGPRGIRLGTNIDGTSDFIVLAIQSLTGQSEVFYASMSYEELF